MTHVLRQAKVQRGAPPDKSPPSDGPPPEAEDDLTSHVLPSGALISFSEINTFESCKLKHFYRYKMRLSSRRYSGLRHLVVGSIVHDAIEETYVREMNATPIGDPLDVADEIAAEIKKEYTHPAWFEFFDEDAFNMDAEIARHLFRVWYNSLYRVERFSIFEPERAFETTIAGQGMLGYMDQVYTVGEELPQVGSDCRYSHAKEGSLPPGNYLGEVKTRGASWSRRCKTLALKSLQVKLYLTAMYKDGLEPQGAVYTVLKKPPKKVMFADDLKAALPKVAEHYARTDIEHFRRDIVPITVDEAFVAEVEEEVEPKVEAIRAFYEGDPFEAASRVSKPSPNGYPCGWCDYNAMCHGSRSFDDSFAYKRRRTPTPRPAQE